MPVPRAVGASAVAYGAVAPLELERVPIEASLGSGWQHVKKNILLLFAISTLAGLVLAVPSVVHHFINDIVNRNLFLMICLGLYVVLIPILYNMGRIKVMLRFNRGEPFTSDDFVLVAPRIFHYVLLLICRTILICFGYLFFIVPGVILNVRLDYADYFVIDKRMNAFAAMKHSWRITQNSVLMLWLFALTCHFVETLGLIALIIGVVPAKWMTGIAKAFVFDRLCATSVDPQMPVAGSDVSNSSTGHGQV